MRKLPLFGALAAAFALSACQSPEGAGWGDLNNPDFGNAVRTTIAVQTVNPDAPRDKGPMTANGATTAAALDRYDHDAVKQPVDTGTSSVGGGSAGTSAGAGSSNP